MSEPSAPWSSFMRRGGLSPQRGQGTGPGRSDGDGPDPRCAAAPEPGAGHGAGEAGGHETPAPHSPTERRPVLPDALGRPRARERRPFTAGSVAARTADDTADRPAGDALLSLPETCRREILRAVVQAARQRPVPSPEAVADAAERDGSDDAWRARAEGTARRTCGYAAALYDSAPAGRRAFTDDRLPPFCTSCSSEAPTIELPPYRADPEPPAVLQRVPSGGRAAAESVPDSSDPAGPRRRHLRARWWALAVSATAVVGGTAALQHDGPAGGVPRPATASAPDAPPASDAEPPTAATDGTTGTNGSPAGAPSPAADRQVPTTPGPPTAPQFPGSPDSPESSAVTGLPPSPYRSPPDPTPPVPVRPSPSPNPAETQQPSPEPPSGPPGSPGTSTSSEPPSVIPPSASASPAARRSPPTRPEVRVPVWRWTGRLRG